MMQTLPNDIIPIIFGYILKITDKRQFTQTCVSYNNITKQQIKNVNIKCKIKYDYYPNFEYKHNKYCVDNFIIELCHDSYFDFISTKYVTNNNTIVIRASIVYNNIKLLQMAIDNGCEINGRDCCIAIEYGRLDIFKLLINYGARWDYTYGTLAGELDHLDILICAKENNLFLKFDNICYYAIKKGHLNIVKLCVNNGYKMEYAYNIAKKHKKYHIIEWLENNEYI